MAKRSPILGFNHNVRYRGLVFHVQTEDSGVLAPHLFTHLFHAGVIVSTRKYVYDSGSTEEAIKALMQAQHKAVLKDLRRGQFDDKIDQYLGGTPGLLPREGAAGAEEVTDPERARPPFLARATLSGIEPVQVDPDDPMAGATVLDGALALAREPTLEEPNLGLRPTEPAVDRLMPTRAKTAEPAVPRTGAPAGVDAAAPVVGPAAVAAYETVRVEGPGDSQPEILIQLEVDDSDDVAHPRRRMPRDTDVGPDQQTRPTLDLSQLSDGVPGAFGGPPTLRNPGEASGPVLPPGSSGPATGPLSPRASTAVGAATLPPARPISRPPSRPAMVPPQVVSRPLAADDRRTPPPDAVEVYAPPPSSAELPQAPERPGQYSQHKKISTRIPPEVERSGPRPLHPQQGMIPQIVRQGSAPHIPAPVRAGAAQQTAPRVSPGRNTPVPQPAQAAARATPPPASEASPSVQPSASRGDRSGAAVPRAGGPARVTPVPQPARSGGPPHRPTPVPLPAGRGPGERDLTMPRTQTPQRVSAPTPPTATPAVAEAGSEGARPRAAGASGGAPRTGPSSSSGVVMTRPAVIVGAPSKPASTSHRVRKAREDEGRGFGQGLISEKSLDEVILAYLSEDAEDK